MANSQKGEIPLTLAGVSYTFKMGTSALIELQEAFSTPTKVAAIPDIFNEVNKGRIKYVRAFLWAGLRKFHPTVTLEDVSDMLDACDETEIATLLRRLGVTTQPDPKDIKELQEGVARNPPTAQTRRTRGTGGNSTSKPAASV